LKSWGLPVFAKEHHHTVHSLQELMAFATKIEKQRDFLPFEIDGIVVKLSELKDRDILGSTAKTPRWAVAYKFAPEQATTLIEEIGVQVGRTGVLTPVAHLSPVFLSGSTITRATLHNIEEIERKDIRVSDHVIIEKGGDVIPKVVSVDLKQRSHDSKPWKMPHECPMCGTPVIRLAGEVAYRCPNKSACPGQQLQKIIFFASKKAFDIEHLGERNIEKFVQMGLVQRIPDIFRLTEQSLATVEGFKEKSIENLLTSIEKAKKCPLERFILALGIKNVGEETAYILAKKFGSIEKVMEVDLEALTKIEGIGPIVAQSIVDYFEDPDHLEDIKSLLELGVEPLPMAPPKAHQTLDGKTFVLTGTLKNYSRSEATKLIRDKGGAVSSSVSKKIDYVVVGEDAGSKLSDAKKHNVPILTEEEFSALLN
jgi:DNA ligase (NAD+)